MNDYYKVHITVSSHPEGFYEAQATLHETYTFGDEPDRPFARSECLSRDKNRAISYALSELAEKLSPSR